VGVEERVLQGPLNDVACCSAAAQAVAEAVLDEATALPRTVTVLTQYGTQGPVFPPTPEGREDGTWFTDGEAPTYLPAM